MHDEPGVAGVGVPVFQMVAFFEMPLMAIIVYTNAPRGAGDTQLPLIVNICGLLLVQLPLAWLFGFRLQGRLVATWVGMCADMLVQAIAVSALPPSGMSLHARINREWRPLCLQAVRPCGSLPTRGETPARPDPWSRTFLTV